jgi:hypothetical protein
MSTSSQNFLATRERERNASTREAFSAYAQHRARQMALLSRLSGERIAILGAGNCNDIELSALAKAFREIHLFDIDGTALSAAVERQSDDVKCVCQLHETDLTGVASFLEAWRDNPPEIMVAQVAAWEQLSPLIAEVGEFDVVLSSCLLSQLAINLRDYFGLVPALNSALPAGASSCAGQTWGHPADRFGLHYEPISHLRGDRAARRASGNFQARRSRGCISRDRSPVDSQCGFGNRYAGFGI